MLVSKVVKSSVKSGPSLLQSIHPPLSHAFPVYHFLLQHKKEKYNLKRKEKNTTHTADVFAFCCCYQQQSNRFAIKLYLKFLKRNLISKIYSVVFSIVRTVPYRPLLPLKHQAISPGMQCKLALNNKYLWPVTVLEATLYGKHST